MDIGSAHKAFSSDRLLILGLLQFLLHKGIIDATDDMALLRDYCLSILDAFRKTQDAVTRVHLDETEAELEHLFRSFRLR
jgi:hypothetical protein